EARPEYGTELGDGELVCRQSPARFVIRLNERHRVRDSACASMWNDSDDPAQLEGIGRGRFTYAHEFCHRFFYVPTDVGWQRAVTRVVQRETDSARQWRVMRLLGSLEEQLCSLGAGELLVPSSQLAELVGRSLLSTE